MDQNRDFSNREMQRQLLEVLKQEYLIDKNNIVTNPNTNQL
jgi:hypothetical protein